MQFDTASQNIIEIRQSEVLKVDGAYQDKARLSWWAGTVGCVVKTDYRGISTIYEITEAAESF